MITLIDNQGIKQTYKNKEECFNSLYDKFKKKYPTTNLYYVDYSDELEEQQLQDGIHNGKFDIYEYYELGNTIDYLCDEVFTSKEIRWLIEEDYIQNIINYIYEVDESTPEEDLLINTKQYQLRYYTGIHIYEDSSNLNLELRNLGLRIRDNESGIKELREWNYCGGELQILFQPDYEDLMDAIYQDDGNSYIEFTDPCIGLCDTVGGSGGYADFIGTIKLPFNKINIFVGTKGPGYSLVEVYGERLLGDSRGWEIKKAKKKLNSITNPQVEQYAKWDADLKKGICHSDDPRWKSHNYEYRNEPMNAGWTCRRCGKKILD